MLKQLTFLILTASALSLPKQLYSNISQTNQIVQDIVKSNPTWSTRSCDRDGQSYGILEIPAIQPKDHLKAVIICNVHARELLTTEVCLEFARTLYDKKDRSSRLLRKHFSFRIFYMANQMRDNVINGQYCRRTNANDVDLNRNFPSGHLNETKGEETNPGPFGLSEPFSKCVQQQIDNEMPDIFLDIHTGEFSLYRKSDDPRDLIVLNKIVDSICGNCKIRTEDKSGVMFADMKQRRGIQWANLFEIYGGYNDKQSPVDNCYTIFNPKTKLSFDFYLRRAKSMIQRYFTSILKAERQSNKE